MLFICSINPLVFLIWLAISNACMYLSHGMCVSVMSVGIFILGGETYQIFSPHHAIVL